MHAPGIVIGQAVLPLQFPLGSQLWGTLPLHLVCAGAQTPAQAPETQVWLEQAAVPVHWPAALQVCGVLAVAPAQRVAFGVHTPQVPAPRQTGFAAGHAGSFVKRPSAPQVCGVVPLAHCLVPGTHEPAQVPAVHTNGHVVPVLPKWPIASQVCGWSPLHRTSPGLQSPHAPARGFASRCTAAFPEASSAD